MVALLALQGADFVTEAAIDANAPVHDDLDGNGPIDSDEEKDAVMAGLARSRPQPLVTHTLIPTRRKYQLVRMKDMLSQVLGSGSLFSPSDSSFQGRSFFQPDSASLASPILSSAADETTQPAQNRAGHGSGVSSNKVAAAGTS